MNHTDEENEDRLNRYRESPYSRIKRDFRERMDDPKHDESHRHLKSAMVWLTISLACFKLAGVLHVAWWVVFMPMLLPLCVLIAMIALAMLFILVMGVISLFL